MYCHAARTEKPGHSCTTTVFCLLRFALSTENFVRNARACFGHMSRHIHDCVTCVQDCGGERKDRPLNTLPRSPFGAALRRNAVDFGWVTCVRDCGGEERDRPLNTLPRSPFGAALRRTAVEYFQPKICPCRTSARRRHLRRQQPLSTR